MHVQVCPHADAEGPLIEVSPSKIIGIGKNYRAHAQEMGGPLPAEPLLFLKPPSALLPSGGAIVRPTGFERVDHEAELAVVIGRRCRRVQPSEALAAVMGYACANDITVRDLQKKDGQWARAKGFDTFFPFGPKLITNLDPRQLGITARVNGEVRQSGNTSSMIFDVATLIAFVSQHMTLEVGDIISTGTPAGVGNLMVGDVIEVEIEGIGILRNTVVAE